VSARTKLWYLERFGLLDGLTPAQQADLARRTRMIEVRRGERLYLTGDPARSLYLLKAGAIKIIVDGLDGRSVLLTVLRPGDIFGELALVDDSPRDHVAEAAEDSLVCEMSRELLLELIQQSPMVGYQITKLIGLRLRTLRTRVEELLCRSAPARLAQALLHLSERYGVTDADGVLITLRLSQRELGKLVGLSRETVNGILQNWKARNLIEIDRKRIRLRHPDRLRDLK
jgi:CRP-like cAMP-binding protein